MPESLNNEDDDVQDLEALAMHLVKILKKENPNQFKKEFSDIMTVAVSEDATNLMKTLEPNKSQLGIYLQQAVQNEHLNSISTLLEMGEWDFGKEDTVYSFYKAVNTACLKGNLSIVQMIHQFLKQRSDVDDHQLQDLMQAGLNYGANGGHIHVIEWLCDNANADVNKFELYLTPMHCASLGGHEQCVNWLINNGADTNAQERNGCTPIFMAVIEDHLTVAKILYDKDGDIMAKDNYDQTLLFYAKTTSMVRWLLLQGVQPGSQDRGMHTAIDYHRKKNHTELAELMQGAMDGHSRSESDSRSPHKRGILDESKTTPKRRKLNNGLAKRGGSEPMDIDDFATRTNSNGKSNGENGHQDTNYGKCP